MASDVNPHFQTLFFLGICTQRTGQPVSEEVAQTVGRKVCSQSGHHGKGGIQPTLSDDRSDVGGQSPEGRNKRPPLLCSDEVRGKGSTEVFAGFQSPAECDLQSFPDCSSTDRRTGPKYLALRCSLDACSYLIWYP